MTYFVSHETFAEVYRLMLLGEFDTQDIHTAMAAYQYRIPAASVTPELRNEAKQANYVHLYSIGGKFGSL